MPRRSFLMRRVPERTPSAETTEKYLLVWHSGDLYRSPEAFPRLDSPSLFGNDKPLELEIGCGTGEFLCDLAHSRPNTNFVGLDISLKSVQIASINAASLSLENIKFIKAAVQSVYPLLVPGSLSAVYIHFPDPCLHPKYRKRRLVSAALLDNLHRATRPGGKLSIVTDSKPLFEEILQLVERTSFERGHEEPYLVGFDPSIKSRYQAYWEKHGVAIYRLELVRE